VSREVRAVAPASIANLGVGFDVLGACLQAPFDEVIARSNDAPGVTIRRITGDGGRLPQEAANNTAGRAAREVLDRSGAAYGVELELVKGVPAAGGMGSSAASAVAAAVAVDALVGARLDRSALLECALAGEQVAAGDAHGDNVAPSLLGGLVLIRSLRPVDVVPLPVPSGMVAVVLRPPVELATRDARRVLPDRIPLADAVAQTGDLGAFVAALFREDWELLRRAGTDRIAEPNRAPLVPGFRVVQAAALEAGAVACSLSGAGPSVFALCRGSRTADAVGDAMRRALAADTGLDGIVHIGPVDPRGARLVGDTCAT